MNHTMNEMDNTWLFFSPLLWTCAKWQQTTAPSPQPETNDQRKSRTEGTEEASEHHPYSLRATYLSSPLWASHILACTCLWRSRGLVSTPPPLQTPHHRPSSGAEERPGDPHSSRMIDRAAARRKGSCDEREKEKECVPCSLCAFNHLLSCLPQPCQHNRVLTGAVSRQH